jgi:hypothetical protein
MLERSLKKEAIEELIEKGEINRDDATFHCKKPYNVSQFRDK